MKKRVYLIMSVLLLVLFGAGVCDTKAYAAGTKNILEISAEGTESEIEVSGTAADDVAAVVIEIFDKDNNLVNMETHPVFDCAFEATLSGNYKPRDTYAVYVANFSGEGQSQEISVEIANSYTHTITYELFGGENHADNPAGYGNDYPDVELKNPSKTGYTFGGWYKEATYKTKVTRIAKTDTKDYTLYAKWTPIAYTVKFDANVPEGFSGTGTVKDIAAKYDVAFKMPENQYKIPGMEFVGWAKNAAAEEAEVLPGEEVKNLSALSGVTVKYYAIWKLENYTISYVTGGANFIKEMPATYTTVTGISADQLTDALETVPGFRFAGWYKSSDFATSGLVTEIKPGTVGNMTLHAKWMADTYTVKFDGNGGTSTKPVADQIMRFGADTKLNANSYKRAGYVFMGWALSSESTDIYYYDKDFVINLVPADGLTREITLYAVWKDSFAINYLENGGSIADKSNYVTYTYGTAMNLPKATRTGYKFGGWYLDEACKKKASITRTTQGDLTVYAKWTPLSYKVVFNSNFPTGAAKTKSQSLTYGKNIVLTANGFTLKGYEFKGWTLSPESAAEIGAETTVKFVNKQSIDGMLPEIEALYDGATEKMGSLNVYAKWQLAEYSISYPGKDESWGLTEELPTSYTVNSDEILLPTAEKVSRDGYTFAGWYSDAACKKAIRSIKKGSTGNLNIYAKWLREYRIVFHGNGADTEIKSGTTLLMPAKDAKVETAISLPANAFAKTYMLADTKMKYAFMGWATSADGPVVYANKAKISNPSALTEPGEGETKAVLHLYAVWKNSFRVTYETNSGDELTIVPSTYNYGVKFNPPVPERTGYKFGGWFIDEACKKKASFTAASQSDMKLYAKWTGLSYKVVFNNNVPEGLKDKATKKNQTLTYGTGKALTGNAFKIKGYTFAGWATEPVALGNTAAVVFSDKEVYDGITTVQAVYDASTKKMKDVNLYAVWTKDTYTIRYCNVTSDWSATQPSSYQVDSSLIKLPTPGRMGYSFQGWYKDEKLKSKATDIKPGSTGNVTLYAKWKQN